MLASPMIKGPKDDKPWSKYDLTVALANPAGMSSQSSAHLHL